MIYLRRYRPTPKQIQWSIAWFWILVFTLATVNEAFAVYGACCWLRNVRYAATVFLQKWGLL